MGDDLGVINKLELTLPVENIATAYNIDPPTNLLMVKTSKKDKFIASDSLTNNKDSFYATYSSTKRAYVFNGLREYIVNIINNQIIVVLHSLTIKKYLIQSTPAAIHRRKKNEIQDYQV